jgi:uncharacterized protein (TIGR00369 family)
MTDPAWKTQSGHSPALDFAALAALVENCAFHKWLGVRLKTLDDTGVAIEMPWRAEFESDPVIGYAHGGILASLIDLAADYAVAARLGRGVPTVDMRIDYHRAAMPGSLLARATVVNLGGTLGTAEARIYDEHENLIASGRALFMTRAPDKRKETKA